MRLEFSAKTKAQAFQRSGGRCEKCGVKLTAGLVEYDHDTPCGLGGDNALSNCVVACKTCHSRKTFGHDNPIMQKADRARKKHYGIKPKRRTIPGRRFDGTPIPSVWK